MIGNNGNRNDDDESKASDALILPSLIVFDLDDCLWTPEMHELPNLPEIPIHGNLVPPTSPVAGVRGEQQKWQQEELRGVIGLQVPGRGRYRSATVTLYDGARRVLYELATNPTYKISSGEVRLATASSSLEPTYSFACLNNIEILPNRTIGDMMSYNQIGRHGVLSSDKVTHFQQLHQESCIDYNEMLFFDDCNWGDNCGRVSKALGVVAHRTPNGLTWEDFQNGLLKFHEQAKKLQRWR